MTKQELLEAVRKQTKTTISKKTLNLIMDSIFENIKKAVKKESRFLYPHFGAFVLKQRKAREGKNPKTGEKIKIKASKTVKFSPSKEFKEII